MPPRRPTLKKSLRAIERAFADIERSLSRLTTRVRNVARVAAKSGKRSNRKGRALRITPKRRAQLRLQGKYMTYMRQLGPRQQARVRAVKEQKGFEAAIRVARRMAGR